MGRAKTRPLCTLAPGTRRRGPQAADAWCGLGTGRLLSVAAFNRARKVGRGIPNWGETCLALVAGSGNDVLTDGLGDCLRTVASPQFHLGLDQMRANGFFTELERFSNALDVAAARDHA